MTVPGWCWLPTQVALSLLNAGLSLVIIALQLMTMRNLRRAGREQLDTRDKIQMLFRLVERLFQRASNVRPAALEILAPPR